MDTETALTRLAAMTAATTAPTLTDTELEALLTAHQVVDSAGLGPTEDDYVPTWDLNRAAAEGWRWKAARLAMAYDFQADGATYNRSQMLAMCEKMITQYQRRIYGSVPVYAPIAAAYPVEDEDA